MIMTSNMYDYLSEVLEDMQKQYEKVRNKVDKAIKNDKVLDTIETVSDLGKKVYPGTKNRAYRLTKETIIILGFVFFEIKSEANRCDVIACVDDCLKENDRDALYERDIADAIIKYFLAFGKSFKYYEEFLVRFLRENENELKEYSYANTITDIWFKKNGNRRSEITLHDLDEIINEADNNYSKFHGEDANEYIIYGVGGTKTSICIDDLNDLIDKGVFCEDDIAEYVLDKLQYFSTWSIKRHYVFLKLLRKFLVEVGKSNQIFDNEKIRLTSRYLEDVINRVEEKDSISQIMDTMIEMNPNILQIDRLGLFAKFGVEQATLENIENNYRADEKLVTETYIKINNIMESETTEKKWKRIEIVNLLVDKNSIMATLNEQEELYDSAVSLFKINRYLSKREIMDKLSDQIAAHIHQPRIITPRLCEYLRCIDNHVVDGFAPNKLDTLEKYALWELLRSQKNTNKYDEITDEEIEDCIRHAYEKEHYYFANENNRLVDKIVKGTKKVEREHLINIYEACESGTSPRELKRMLVYCGFFE